MSWYIGNQKIDTYKDYNETLAALEGELDGATARITLAKFLRTNLAFTLEMLCGIKLMEIQEVILKALFVRDNCLVVAGRGFSKSFLIAIFSILYSIFYPDKKVCLISANFRSARRILEYVEKTVNSKKAALLRQNFPNTMKRGNDIFSYKLSNNSELFALPLSNGEGLRGTRANTVLVDEGLLISREIQESILRPFLTVKQDFQEESEIRTAEDLLIAEGQITEADRISFPKNKYCIFSSASYQFQYLYSIYTQYIDFIENPEKIKGEEGEMPPKYFVIRASYEALPKNGIMDMTQINAAKAGSGENAEFFKREYRALFSNSSEGYFNAKKMEECTIPVLQYPTVQLKGEKNCEYILAIDPSYSASKSSDFFAMSVFLLIKEERKIVLAHSYGKAGGDLREHFEYLVYILTHFNIVYLIHDASGSEFIHGFNESSIAKEKNLSLQFLDVDFEAENYLEELAKAKNQYNLTNKKIVYGQNFTSSSIRHLNEHLQNQIDSKKVWFGSALGANEAEVKKLENFQLPFCFKNNNDSEMGLADFISDQDEWVVATKNQCALIEVRATVMGTLQFDLPQNLRRESGPARARKDHYTCLLLAAWGAKCYYDLIYTSVEQQTPTFEPIFIS